MKIILKAMQNPSRNFLSSRKRQEYGEDRIIPRHERKGQGRQGERPHNHLSQRDNNHDFHRGESRS